MYDESLQVMKTPHPDDWRLREEPLGIKILQMASEQARINFLFAAKRMEIK